MQNATPSSKKPSSSSETAKHGRNASRLGGRGDAPDRRRGRGRASGRPDRHEVSAGGVIYRRRNGNTEIFFIKDAYGRWTFPKGHQELGETLAETAIREIREETGLTGLRYVAPVGKKILRFRREVGLIQKAVHYFLFEAPADAKERLPTREDVGEGHELIQDGKWVPMRQAFSVSSYKNSDHLLASAFRLIAPGAGSGGKNAMPDVQAAGSPIASGRKSRRRRRWKRRGGPRPAAPAGSVPRPAPPVG